MSEVKRYSFWPQIVHLPGGGGVRAEVHFKVEEDGLFVAHQDYASLKAEVERLRKAGDAMALCIIEFRCGKYGNALDKVGGFYVWQDWLAAKEGKPSV